MNSEKDQKNASKTIGSNIDGKKIALPSNNYHTVHFRSLQDPYTIHHDDNDNHSCQSTLNTNNIASMLSGGLEHFYSKYQHLSKCGNIHLPTPEIHFENLTYSVTCSVDSQVETVGSALQNALTFLKKPKTYQKEILHPMNGIVKPGSMTLLLGGPSSGKSTFLKALGGRLNSASDETQKLGGTIQFNGLSAEQLDLSKLVGLVDQTDDHVPTLTVRETIQFADTCLNGRVEDRPVAMQGVAALRTELMLHLLGLTRCADTVVGDAMLRGVSGGERKRVTVGEMLVGGQSIFLCDEISTGLDSAATFDIMTSLRSWAKVMGGTAIVALLQPPPEVVELFDNILVLSDGQMVYHGPRTSVLPYFNKLGYSCPHHVDPADFLVDVTGGRGYDYRNGNVPEDEIAVTPTDFAKKFFESDIHQIVGKELRKGFHLSTQFENPQDFLQFKSVANLAQSKAASPFAVPFLPSTLLVLKRQSTIFLRDKPLLYGKLAEAFVVGILLGIIYYNAKESLYLRMMFFMIAIFQRQAWQQITISFQLRSIFYKQRSRNFFRTASYGIADALVQIPINLVVSFLMGTVFYFLSGLNTSVGTYAAFIMVLVVFQHAIGSFFTMLSVMSPNITIAQALAGISVCFFLLFSGNIILADLIPSHWLWMFWFDPLSWALRSVILNEFTSDGYTIEEGKSHLEAFQISQGSEFVWIGVSVLFLYYIFFTVAQTGILHLVRYDQKKGSSGGDDMKLEQDMDEEGTTFIEMKNGNQSNEANTAVTPAFLVVQDLDYIVPGKVKGETIQLLHGVTATFKPGTMTALMGSSGAGKTTLIDVLAGRKTGGSIGGNIIVNGQPKNPLTFSRIAAYCEQMDIHCSATTVREALLFSAKLRLPSKTSLENTEELVQETLELLELDKLANKLVGTLQTGGLSIEQRKRLTIACELVANPSILFLDEPTSGLDARSALLVMRGVKKIAASGRTVICTIHQPSVQIFNLFDSLLLLQRGGHTAFFGELGTDSENMIGYFENIPGTDEIQPQYNPATYMLEVIGAGIDRKDGSSALDYAEQYKKSDLCKRNGVEAKRLGDLSCGEFHVLPSYSAFATDLWTQMKMTTIRATKMYWRSPSYNFIRIILFPLFAVIFGTTFFQIRRDTEATVNSLIALIYNSMDFIGVINLMTVLDITCAERAVYYRERSSNMYSAFPYSFALCVAELPYLLCISAFFILAEYFLVGLQQEVDSFALFWLVFFLYISICTFLGQWMCALTPNGKVANVAVGALSCFMNLFSGYLVPFVDMKAYYKWVRYLMPSSYALNALVSSQMGLCEANGEGNGCDKVQLINGNSTSLAEYIQVEYGFEPEKRFQGVAILIVICIMIQFFIYLTLRFVNHLKR